MDSYRTAVGQVGLTKQNTGQRRAIGSRLLARVGYAQSVSAWKSLPALPEQEVE